MTPSAALRCSLLTVAVLALGHAESLAQGPPTGGPSFDWDRSPSAVVLRFEERSDKLVQANGPQLVVYGDGRVVAHRPEHLRNPGERAIRLSEQQLQALFARVAQDAVIAFDTAAVFQERESVLQRLRAEARAQGGSPPLNYTSETERVSLQLRLTKLRPAGEPGPARERVDVEIVWRGLRGDLRELPGTTALVALKAAAESCLELLMRAELGGQ